MVIDLFGNVSTAVGSAEFSALSTRVSACETNIQTLIDRGVPIQGSFTCGDWNDGGYITFAAWTASTN